MRRTTLCALACAVSLGVAAGASADELVILAGQSNAGVYKLGPKQLPPGTFAPTPRVRIWTAAGFQVMRPGVNTGLPNSPNAWGPEVGFAKAWSAAHPMGVLYVVKAAKGSTGLAMGAAPNWSPAAPASLFAHATDLVRGAEAAAGLRACELLWMQGEQDAADPAAAADYRANLSEFLARARGAWAVDFVEVGQIGRGLPFSDRVRAAQAEVVAHDGRSALVDTDRLPRQPDGLHLAASGALRLGEDFYRASARHRCDRSGRPQADQGLEPAAGLV